MSNFDVIPFIDEYVSLDKKHECVVLFISSDTNKFNSVEGNIDGLPSLHANMHHCANELEAYNALDKGYVDACIIDHKSIKTPTDSFIKNIRQQYKEIPIILFENTVGKTSYQFMEDVGADGFLCEKGLTPITLETVLMNASRIRNTNINSQETFHALTFIGHELKTPLCSILGFSELLLMAKDSTNDKGADHDYIKHISDSGRQIADIVDDTIYISKVSSGDYTGKDSKLDFNLIIEDCEKELSGLLAAKNISIQPNIADEFSTIYANNNLLNHCLKRVITRIINTTKVDTNINITVCEHDRDNIALVFHDINDELKSEFEGYDLDDNQNLWRRIASLNKGHGLSFPLSYVIMKSLGGSVATEIDKDKRILLKLIFPNTRTTPHESCPTL